MMRPDTYDSGKKHRPRMLTAEIDLALRFGPVYNEIALAFENRDAKFPDAFACA